MGKQPLPPGRSRRDFLKDALILGSLMPLGSGKLFAQPADSPVYRYGTVSVDRLPELAAEYEKTKNGGQASRNSTFRKYVDGMKFQAPESFKQARSLVVLAVFTRSMKVAFHWKGKKKDVVIPPQYYDDGVSPEQLKQIIRTEIIGNPQSRVEWEPHLPLKLMAVRSGLGSYGINNICYVDGMGSFLTLYGFWTGHRFMRETWRGVQTMEACKKCKICYGACPMGCISRDRFVIDAGRCITLYNEIEGPFPSWIPKRVHNALMGCMKCQSRCPEDMKIPLSSGRLEDVTEEETKRILEGKPDEALIGSLKRKLKDFYPAASKKAFPMFTRNLGVLIG
jgi:epoxyqueuosine reductase